MLALYVSMLDSEAEKRSFTEIYEKYKRLCFHVAFKITQNEVIAEDAVHNAFLAIIKHKDEIFTLPGAKRKTKIVIIVKNKAIDLIRMERRRAHLSFDEIEEEGADDVFDASTLMENNESYTRLINHIQTLPALYKTALYLRYVYGMSNQDMADYLDVKPKTVSMRISRAKIMLQEMLNKGDDKNG